MAEETSSKVKIPRKWPFHPKYIGFTLTIIFFPLAVITGSDPSFSVYTTVFAFFGGAGFTAWLSMSIYEYIHEQGQRREWKHRFDAEMVKDFYGPTYDELQRALNRLKEDFIHLNVSPKSSFDIGYVSLIAPVSLAKKGRKLWKLVKKYNENVERWIAILQNVIQNFARDYLAKYDIGINQVPSLRGSEAGYILGASAAGLRDSYEEFILSIVSIIKDVTSFEIKRDDPDRKLRKLILDRPEAKMIIKLSNTMKPLFEDVLEELEPIIKEPYNL